MVNSLLSCPKGGDHELEYKGTEPDGGGVLECKKCGHRIVMYLDLCGEEEA
jgi:hypothetical protein